ncbi:MAG: hypothetical protein LUE64_02520 [Candidatus Gastranaerophilales bacterium]|nr:hypothetical protein [Candidatus Gastranaerophilales bacterium]
MSISAISAALSASYMYGSSSQLNKLIDKLTEDETSASSVSSASESDISVETEETEETEANQGNSDLMERAKTLAQKLGIDVNDNDDLDEILDEIQIAIDELMDKAVENNDESLFNVAKGYKSELNMLIEENNGGSVSPTIVYSFMDMIAEQNKYALGIAQK